MTDWTAARLVKFGVSGVVAAFDRCLSAILPIIGTTPRSRCVILYYHEVTAQSRDDFAQQLDDIVAFAQPIRLDQPPPSERGRRYVAVTFDDGFRSVVDNALPELEKRSIPSTHFVVAGALGRSPNWVTYGTDHSTAEQEVMSAEQLTQLSSLVTIGSHTLTHPLLPGMNETDARRELGESRRILESLAGRRVDLFSFPYGGFTAELVGWCAEAGYARVFTTQPVYAFADDREFVTGRVPVSPHDSRLEFRLKLLGAYRWLPRGVAVKRQVRRYWTIVRERTRLAWAEGS